MSRKDFRILLRIESELLPLLDEVGRRTGHNRSGALRYCLLQEAARRRIPIPEELKPNARPEGN